MIAISLTTLIVGVVFGLIHFVNTSNNELRAEIDSVRDKVFAIDGASGGSFSDWFEQRSGNKVKKTKTGNLILKSSEFRVECKLLE